MQNGSWPEGSILTAVNGIEYLEIRVATPFQDCAQLWALSSIVLTALY